MTGRDQGDTRSVQVNKMATTGLFRESVDDCAHYSFYEDVSDVVSLHC